MRTGKKVLFLLFFILTTCSNLSAQQTPTANNETGDKTVPAAETPPPAPGYRRLVFKAKRILVSGAEKSIRYIGDVSVESESFKMTADEIVYSDKDGMIYAVGNVTMNNSDGNLFSGKNAQVNVHTRAWSFNEWQADILPGSLGKPFKSDLYLKGATAEESNGKITTKKSSFTTCEKEKPDYEITARQITIIPGDKLIARDCFLKLGGYKVLYFPYFIIFLKKWEVPFKYEIGQNSTEGNYIHSLFQYAVNDQNLGGVRLDISQKLPIGIGVDHFYEYSSGNGEILYYTRVDGSEFQTKLNHNQRLLAGFTGDFAVDRRKSTNYGSTSTLTVYTVSLTKNTEKSNTYINYNHRVNDSTFKYDSTSANVSYNLRVDKGTFGYNGQYSRYGSFIAGAADSKELWHHLTAMRQLGPADINVKYDIHDDLAGNASSFSGMERLPEVVFTANSYNSTIPMMKKFPGTLSMGWGFYNEMPNQVSLDRYMLQANIAPPAKDTIIGRISFNGDLRQTVYGDVDSTAMYNYNAGLNLQSSNGPLSNNLRYSRVRKGGYTPFRFDSIYPSQIISDTVQYRTANMNVYLSAGKNLDVNRWDDIYLRMDQNIGENFKAAHSLGYDPNIGIWRDLNSQFSWDNGENIALRSNTIYNMELGKMRRVSGDLTLKPTSKWRIHWLSGYDFVSKQFLYNEYLVTRDLHCWDVSAYYSQQQKSFYMYLRLKAMDLPMPRFGVGRGGQVLDTVNTLPY
jgi:hypothetical protein